MNIKKTVSILILFAFTCQYLIANDDQFVELKKLVLEMKGQLQKQQNEINSLRNQLQHQNEVISENDLREGKRLDDRLNNIDERMIDFNESYSVIKDSPRVKLGKKIDRFAIKGDARFRYERQERQIGAAKEQTRDRQRLRLRIGGTWTNQEDSWEFGVGVATGGTGATSTNDTFSDGAVFETGDLRVDYAYAKHNWENVKLTIGQQKNPFQTSFILWDGDVRPVGLTTSIDFNGLFVTTGVYDVFHIGRDEANAILFGSQMGYTYQSEDVEVVVAGAYYHFNDAATSQNFDPETMTTNPPPGIPGTLDAIDDDFDFNIGDFYFHLKTKIGDAKVKLFGHGAINFGADGVVGHTGILDNAGRALKPDDNDSAWAVGISGEAGRLKLGYTYAAIEADSMYSEIKDSDFGDTAGMTDTDVKGHKFSVKYKLKDTVSLGGTYLDLKEINGVDQDGELYQLDLIYKF